MKKTKKRVITLKKEIKNIEVIFNEVKPSEKAEQLKAEIGAFRFGG